MSQHVNDLVPSTSRCCGMELTSSHLHCKQNYVNGLLDVVDGGVKDADTINVQLDRVAAILATDVNNTDISTQMEVPAIVQSICHQSHPVGHGMRSSAQFFRQTFPIPANLTNLSCSAWRHGWMG
jgi:hypothetical protein